MPNTTFVRNATDKEKHYFSNILTGEILQKILDETNRYTIQNALRGRKGNKECRIYNNWLELTIK